ncbi:uncharacterized protein LOC126367932 [Pectinophora gossypiella]|uniref:uncharacterized protein LOC126367932 n=1 Tax=Pectinophora gossypiella TaxID=13191 RepID=UPI00214F0609|nr:uncharacterized protein LOC126367932 [Pectinophora gossypiella]
MFPARFTTGQSSAVRKPRVDGKPSMLPKPRRPGSTDRASVEARRPSTSHRSSSAEPVRATLAGGRLSREASASKLPLNRRSRSQQADRYGQSSMTPLRSSHYARTTTTPVRTPSEDRQNRSWQASLDRALAFVTIKDQRPLSSPAWLRAEFSRVSEALGLRGAGAAGGGLALVRPLTITRFVDICGGLLAAIMRDTKLNNDNYVAKLPNLAKRFLYPGAVSKSWLKTVNTLHAFPHALAFIAFFLDLVNHIETPVSDEWLYAEKDELACLRRDFLYKSWIRFQDPGHEFEDLDAEYLLNLKQLLGHDEQRVAQLQETIQQCEAALEDESELAARAEEERVRARREAAAARLRAARADGRRLRAHGDAQRARRRDLHDDVRALDADIASITAEIQQLKRELECQDISVAERARLLDEVDYATRVIDSKRTLAEQVSKIMLNKETELALWQKRTLDSCVEYKQALIHLAARFPPVAGLAVDEQELMEARCAEAVSRAVDTLRAHAQQLAERRAEHTRARAKHCRLRQHQLEETKAKIEEMKSVISREQQALDSDSIREATETASWTAERDQLAAKMEELRASEAEYARAQAELDFWEKQEVAWTTRLAEMREYIARLREQLSRELDAEKKKKANQILDAVCAWHMRLDAIEDEEQRRRAGDNQRAL